MTMTETTNQATSGDVEQETWIPVHRVVLPAEDDPTVLPLYVDWKTSISSAGTSRDEDTGFSPEKDQKSSKSRSSTTLDTAPRVITSMTRNSVTIPAGRRLSFATYFNAFPAAYWREWTKVDRIKLRLTLSAAARVDVYRSTARGSFNRVAGAVGQSGELEFELSLTSFGDGGWLWFDVEASQTHTVVTNAEWLAPTFVGYRAKKVSVAITTFNRPDDCVAQMNRFAQSPELLERLDQLMITDQGTKPVEKAEGYDDAEKVLGEQFRLIKQGNLGGSGGFARGMYEGTKRSTTDYVMLLDDDVVVETESILRAVAFADFTRKPTIVGGHMLNLYERSMLHSFGERIDKYRFVWGPINSKLEAFDFAKRSLRETPALHRRMDVEYNGWWMCLIPREIIEEIGLSLPVFIKWDDAEYGLRAAEHGYKTVSLPGAAVWHMPWTEKDDRLDWQAYFHQRNQWLVAMLYSPYKNGGEFQRLSFAIDVRHLVSMQYSAVALRLKALEDILSGPDHLQRGLPTINSDVRKLRGRFTDAQVIKSVEDYPEVKRHKPPTKGKDVTPPRTLPRVYLRAVEAVFHALRRPDEGAKVHPEARIGAADALWWRLATVDSALVTTADGAGTSLYQRDNEVFRKLLIRSVKLHARLRREWPRLQREYREGLPEYCSVEVWRQTFDIQD